MGSKRVDTLEHVGWEPDWVGSTCRYHMGSEGGRAVGNRASGDERGQYIGMRTRAPPKVIIYIASYRMLFCIVNSDSSRLAV